LKGGDGAGKRGENLLMRENNREGLRLQKLDHFKGRQGLSMGGLWGNAGLGESLLFGDFTLGKN